MTGSGVTGTTVRTLTRVKMVVPNNVTWQDTFMFGVPGDTSWSFSNKFFTMYLKRSKQDPVAELQLSSGLNTLVVQDPVNRILSINVPEATLQALYTGKYVFDLVMTDNVTGARTLLMGGEIEMLQGITTG